MNIQLTISMLVSDRSTTLKKCLDSLKELLCELSCELIVVFTGEQEETLNIVKQYTDHIIPFKWCNDFSAARNVGLREAKGEWFMYIDDDEWFEDVSEIISFFKTRECDAYESAAYVARNYQDWEAKEYIDAYIVRLYRNDGKLEFTSSIHEAINKLGVPRKFFKNYVHHYGYVSDGKKEAKKSDRNIPLLLEEIEKNSTSTKNYMQLAQEYKGTHEFDKAEECCRKGISIALHESKFYTSDMWMIAYLPIFIALQGEDEKALSEAERFLKDEEVINLSKIYLCHTAVVCCLRLKKFEKGLKYVKEFYEIWKRLRKEEEAGQRYEHADMNLLEAGKKVQQVYICGLHLAVKAKDFKSVSQILKWIPWEDETAMKSYYPELEKWKNSFPDEKKKF